MIRVFLILCVTSCGLASVPNEKCKVTDHSCIKKVTNLVYKNFFIGDDNGLEPIHHDVIEGNQGKLHYKFTDIIVKGYKNCIIEDGSLDIDNLRFEVILLCDRLTMEGKYNVSGIIFELPVEGSGNFFIEALKYRIQHHMVIELSGTVSETYFQIKISNFDAEPLDGIVFKFDNLYNGNKELADPIHKFLNENWNLVAKDLQKPFLQFALHKIETKANDNFKKSSLQKYFIL